MRIVHVNTWDIAGGAARSMYRLHAAMRSLGEDSQVVCYGKHSRDDSVSLAYAYLDREERDGIGRMQEAVNRSLLTGRTMVSDTIFTASVPGVDLTRVPQVRDADVVALHWVAQFVSPASLAGLLGLGKPVIWRLPDMWPFTGGCHYAGDCLGFLRDCRDCPQVKPSLAGVPAAVLAAKKQAVLGSGLTVVCPSRWIYDLVGQSAVFKGCRRENIINGVNNRIFRPASRAKHRLGLPDGLACVLFVATHAERRKGFDLFLKALSGLRQTLGGDVLPDGRRLALCVIGDFGAGSLDLGLPVIPFEVVDNDEHLRLIYSAADVYAFSSMEDNLPSTVLEAMACAVPVAAFATGGVPDTVRDGVTGILARPGDVEGLGRAMLHLLLHPVAAREMGLAGRRRVDEELNAWRQAGRYLDLLRDLKAGPAAPKQYATRSPDLGLPVEYLWRALAWAEPESPCGRIVDRAMGLKEAGQAEDGLRLLEALAVLYPDDLSVRIAWGGLLAATGRAGEAVERFRSCLDADPRQLGRYLNMSDALRYAGRHEEALEVLEELEAQSPGYKGLWLKRGQVLAAMHRNREAARAFIREARRHACPRARALLREVFPLRNC